MTPAELHAEFGGQWERGEREIHGLLKPGGRALKIEVLQASKWRCSIFERGTCVASSTNSDLIGAIRGALRSLEG